MYANLILPGQTVNLHLDVPEFIGLDRSKSPSWLLVAAHCSGLFSSFSVRNLTAVCYPLSAQGGELAVYQPGVSGTNYKTSSRVQPFSSLQIFPQDVMYLFGFHFVVL